MSLWKCISGVWDYFSRFVHLKMGDGSNVWLCYDIWCEDIALKDRFSELFSVNVVKGFSLITIANIW